MHHTSHTRTSITLIPLFWYFLKRPQPVTGNGQRATAPQLFYYKLEICLKCAPDLNALTRMAVALGTSGLGTGGNGKSQESCEICIRLGNKFVLPHLSLAKHLRGSHDKCCNWQLPTLASSNVLPN